MARRTRSKRIRVGVVGVGRGQTFARGAELAGMELVALCDIWEDKLRQVASDYGVAAYTEYDRFLEHDMDAVVLANYFHEHAPLAIKALRAGKHVMSECAACNSLAEGVALCRAVEESGRIYMFAENYPFTAPNQEMARLYKAGEIGRVLYAEGEYNHPGSFQWAMGISPGLRHWRNNIPSTYYCTHAMAPLMYITDTMPVRVNGFTAPLPEDSPKQRLWRQQDKGGLIIAVMDNGAVFKLLQGGLPGHSIFYRLHGEFGLMESGRGPGYWGSGSVRLVHDEWELKRGQVPEKVYYPQFPEWAREALSAGHGGGDFFTNHYFAEAIRAGEQPYLDVYRGVAMSVIGILAWKSVLDNGNSYAVPDFRRESSRRTCENDNWRPMDLNDPNAPPISSRGKVREVIPENLEEARRIWRKLGYTGE
ncbi:MAG: Gfo/Idh/MocA family oxidoreductase [Chloroflexi bacterium]|nr:Gfo/Idh/MocA family oxidoreductase [Chloroflexota bacterium]